MSLLFRTPSGRFFCDFSSHRRLYLGQCFAGYRVFQLGRLRVAWWVAADE